MTHAGGDDMWPTTTLLDLLRIDHPIVQAPMAAISTAPLAAAVSKGGALGSIGSATMSAEEVTAQVRALREQTGRPFNLNFFVHRPPRNDEAVAGRMRARLERYRVELGAAELPAPETGVRPFDAATLELLLELRPPVVSFHFGLPDAGALATLRSAGVRILASATTVAEAKLLEDAGVDAVIAQGAEAGGHRGTFAASYAEGEIGTMALVPQIVAAVRVPVIAAGGIMDGRGIAAALALGAAGAQLGTAFLGCPEAQIDPLYRQTLFEPRAARTRLTTLFTGRPARVIVTRFLEEMADEEGHTPEFPLQRAFTAPLARAASARGDAAFLAMYAGQGAPLVRWLPAGELVATLVQEAASAPLATR
jgi:nitronate monooxygenase